MLIPLFIVEPYFQRPDAPLLASHAEIEDIPKEVPAAAVP